jgi:hypothetical protein
VGPRAGLEAVKKRKVTCDCRQSNPDLSEDIHVIS